jgi:deoxyuridine 5''-triphosphate nucleotidohydrolase (dut)
MNHPPAATTSTASMASSPPAPGVPTPYVGLVDVALQRLDADLPLPTYAHPGDAGADLVTRVDVELPPGGRATVPTGVAIALPEGYAAFVHPRSGLAARCGVTTLNAPGTVDAGYRGEIQVTLLNTDLRQAVVLRRGERIAQLVVQRVEHAVFVPVAELPGSARGAGGHGSTGGFAGHDARPGTNVGADAPEGETT